MNPRDFEHDGRKLKVKAFLDDAGGWQVRVFENNIPVTGVVYSVSHETAVDAALRSLPLDLVDELMKLAQSDIENGVVPLV